MRHETTSEAIRCDVCPHRCLIAPGARGRCRARVNRDGAIVCESYGKLTAMALDPIEKKPLARFMPGSTVLSVSSYGCNMACPACQNHQIAQSDGSGLTVREFGPREIADAAKRYETQGCIGVAFTYNEPLVGWEFVRDVGQLVHGQGLVNVLVSNGLANPWVIDALAPLVDAANIDLKCFEDSGYASLGGDLATVQRTIQTLATCGTCHVEVTTLVVPGFNDSAEQIEAAAAWLAGIDPTITYHLTRFFPAYRLMVANPTPPSKLFELRDAARMHLEHVVLGNI